MRIAFYVSGKAGRLNKILKKQESYLNQIKLIFSDDSNNQYLSEVVENFGDVEYVLFEYSKIVEKDKNLALSDCLLKLLKKHEIDYCFSFGDHILKGLLLKEYEYRIINFHPSLLPMFKGRNAIDQAIASNTLLIGCSAHFIDEGTDTGPIIMQSVMSRYVFENGDYDSVLDTQIEMLRKIIEILNQNKIKIVDKKVIIKDADYSKVGYFPAF